MIHSTISAKDHKTKLQIAETQKTAINPSLLIKQHYWQFIKTSTGHYALIRRYCGTLHKSPWHTELGERSQSSTLRSFRI